MREILKQAAQGRRPPRGAVASASHQCSSSLVMTGPLYPQGTHPAFPWLAADLCGGPPPPGPPPLLRDRMYASSWEPGKEGHSLDLASRAL